MTNIDSGNRPVSRSRSRNSGWGSRSPSRSRSVSKSDERMRSISRSLSRSRSRSRSVDSSRGLKCVVVRGLTKNVAVEHLEEIFDAYGKIVHVELVKARKINTTMGYAFIFYEHVEDAEDACDFMHKGIIDEVKVTVDMSKMTMQKLKDRQRSPPRRGGYRQPPPRRGRESPPKRGGYDDYYDDRRRSYSPPYRRRSPSYQGRYENSYDKSRY